MSTVFFATNRTTTNPTNVSGYGDGIQPPSISTNLVYGTAFITLFDGDHDERGEITSLNEISIGRFSQNAVDDLENAGRNLLIFIHGFDNTFSDALVWAASNGAWLGAAGQQADMSVISFSWPSLGQLVDGPVLPSAYLHDQNMARLSGVHLMTFFANLEPILTGARANGYKTYLLAHSMGHLALQSAVENWFLHGNGNAKLFDAAFLAAGDCGYDAFNQPDLMRLSGLSDLAEKVVIYYSHVDQVLQLSAFVNVGAQRLGQSGPEDKSDETRFPPGIFAMVNATSFQDYPVTFLTSHQYYRESPTCRADIVAHL